MLSKCSVRLATQGAALVHNLMMGPLTYVGEGTGTRYTPYHIRHRTEVAGFMTFQHGDDRFYNNIFVQGWDPEAPAERGGPREKERLSGTWCFDEYPDYNEWISWFDLDVKRPSMHKLGEFQMRHLPVWIDGNAYLCGSKPWDREANKLVCEDAQLHLELVEKDGHTRLNTNLFDILGDFAGGIITSDVLGCAFEPEQRYEMPDGTAITFDSDYFGDHRGVKAAPGPFASKESLEKNLW